MFYNITDGGSRGSTLLGLTEEQMKIRSEKISFSNSGEKHYNYGKHLSKEVKQKLSLAHKGKKILLTVEQRRLISESHRGVKSWNHRRVVCLNTLEVFEFIRDTSRIYPQSDYSGIGGCCNKKLLSSGKEKITNKPLVWAFYEDYSKMSVQDIANKIQRAIISNGKRVICLNTKEIFISLVQASEKYNIDTSNIISCCTGIYKSSGKLADGTPLLWMYYDDNYVEIKDKELANKIKEAINIRKGDNRYNSKKIICLNNKEIFNYIEEVGVKYNLTTSHISGACKGTRKSAGKSEDGVPLVWSYYDDYINLTEEEIEDKLFHAIQLKYRKIICVTTKEIFQKMQDACDKYCIFVDAISTNCRGKSKSVGKDKNGNALTWMYYKDYINIEYFI